MLIESSSTPGKHGVCTYVLEGYSCPKWDHWHVPGIVIWSPRFFGSSAVSRKKGGG